MEIDKNIIVDIDEIKQMKQKGFIGWSKYLLPYCEGYFNAGYSIVHIKDKLIVKYQFDVSISTLNRLLLKYRRMGKSIKPSPSPLSNNPVKSDVSVEQKIDVEKEVGKEESDSFSLPSNKAMEELFNEYNSSRFFERKDPLDDLIAKQKMEKLRKKQGEVRNE